MNNEKTGAVIKTLRLEQHMTQKALADRMHVSDKAVSKWERGIGSPDISLLKELAEILNVNIACLLEGALDTREQVGGNMKKIKFYYCSSCGNLMTSTGDAELSCCGRGLAPMKLQRSDDAHRLEMEDMDDEICVRFTHPMGKDHFLTFLAYVTCDKLHMVKLYPEQGSEIRMPKMRGGRWYYGCSRDGLFTL